MNTQLRDVRSADLTAESPVVLLFLHGFGSHERDLPGLAEHLGTGLPWASLRAPLPAGQGASWFEIITPGNPDAAPVEAATEQVWAWVEANLAPEAKVVPIGFSQGGLMASQLLRTRPERVLAPVVLSGFVLGHPQPADEQLAATKPLAFHGHGSADGVITPAAVQRTRDFLPAHTTLEHHLYPGLQHGISAPEVADLRDFLARALRQG